jgi:hypothetical protein
MACTLTFEGMLFARLPMNACGSHTLCIFSEALIPVLLYVCVCVYVFEPKSFIKAPQTYSLCASHLYANVEQSMLHECWVILHLVHRMHSPHQEMSPGNFVNVFLGLCGMELDVAANVHACLVALACVQSSMGRGMQESLSTSCSVWK